MEAIERWYRRHFGINRHVDHIGGGILAIVEGTENVLNPYL